MKATEQYFHVELFIVLHKVVLMFGSVDEILKCCHSNRSNRAVHCCDDVVTLYKVFLALESVDKILKCDHSNESY